MKKVRLGVNIDHVATLRQLRKGSVDYPDVLEAAIVSVKGGADQITIHLRGDKRHIQESDLELLSKKRPAPLNLEMAATDEMTQIALMSKPDIVCIVPEKREELTTEGGLDVLKNQDAVAKVIETCRKNGIRSSLFIEPSENQIKASHKVKADAVEFHTGKYALARGADVVKHLEMLKNSFELAHNLKLAVHAGHGLDYRNTRAVAELNFIEELNIGHSIVCRSVFVGLEQAVREMKQQMSKMS